MAEIKVQVDRVEPRPAFVDVQITNGDLHVAFELTPQGARGLANNLTEAAVVAADKNTEIKLCHRRR